MTSYYDDVEEFHRTILGIAPSAPTLLAHKFLEQRVEFMYEELDELVTADVNDNIVGVADALADIVYVALGTAYLMGLPFDEIWAAVHRANMAKKLGATKRNMQIDAIKPSDWEGPEDAIAKAINDAS